LLYSDRSRIDNSSTSTVRLYAQYLSIETEAISGDEFWSYVQKSECVIFEVPSKCKTHSRHKKTVKATQ
jgi:hypothetical protein